MTLVRDGTNGFASGGQSIVVLHATKHRQGNQLATGVWLVDQLRIGIGDGMCSLRGARAVVVFDELSRHAPNVAGAQEDEVVERVFA